MIPTRFHFWIALAVMILIVIIVITIKCIPKEKLPYCLGGEKFVCPKKYKEKVTGKFKRTIPDEDLAEYGKLEDAVKKTKEMNN